MVYVRRRNRLSHWAEASQYLLNDIPLAILSSHPVEKFGMSEGMALAAGHWSQRIREGSLPEHTMRASLIPVATLASTMLEAMLRAAPIGDDREACFAQIAEDSRRVLTGRPHAVILQSGIS